MTLAPDGYHTITPRTFADDAEGLVSFIKHVFDATGEYQWEWPSEIRIGDSMVMISGTEFRPAMPACLYVYVADVDTTYIRAVDAGAMAIEAPGEQPYGDRRAMFEDRWSNVWQIASRTDR
jgi:uncharacterized glyoxalase superfamily protein PhnB